MMSIQKKSGFILLFVLMMVSVITLLTQQILRGVMVGTMFDRTMMARERAEILALGGIQVAIALLTKEPESLKVDTSQETKEQEKQDPDKKWLARILPILNRWKIFDLTKKIDGVDGTLKICISAEEGKLNLNEIFDFKAQAFKSDYEPFLKTLTIDKKHPVIKFLTEYFKKRNKKLDDLSELMTIPEFAKLDLFYDPPAPKRKKEKIGTDEKDTKGRNIALFDLFTIDSQKALVQPLLFSDGMCAVFGVHRPEATDTDKMKDAFKRVAQNFKKEWGSDWVKNWDELKPIYEQTQPLHPQFAKIFCKEFEPSVFSVVSLGLVDGVEQRLLAIIKRVEKKKEEKSSGMHGAVKLFEDEKNKAPITEFKIIKIYWI